MARYLAGRASDFGGINIKDKRGDGVGGIRFGEARASQSFTDTEMVLYRYGTGLYLWDGSTNTLLGAAGGGGSYTAPSLDQIFQGDQTLDLTSLSTLTIDRSSGNNDVLTLTNTGTGSGVLLQITNVGTGADISGTGATWSFSKAGVNVMKSTTIAGTAGSTSLTLTAGDVVFSDGSVAITDADNAATFTVTNNTATTASVVVLAGSGVFTGSTTTSFATLTASGLTTGTVLYIPVVALTTGKAIDIVGTTALTTGILVNVESGTTGTSLTGAGRLFKTNHTGATTNSGILNEFLSAATDETTILQITTSQALALGYALKLSTASVTTGTLIGILGAALTTGVVLNIAHATSAITTGSLVRLTSSGVNTGSGGDGTMLDITASGQLAGSLVTIDTIQTTGTAMSIISTGIMTTTGNLLTLTANSATTGAGLLRVNANGLTSGIGLVVTSSSTGLTGAGRLLRIDHTGATGVSTILSEFASAATDETVLMKITASAANALGKSLLVSTATTTGNGIQVTANAITNGFAISADSSNVTLSSTGRLLLINHSGNATVSGVIAEVKSAAADETVIFQVLGSAALAAGKAVNISVASMTTGTALSIANADALTTGSIASFTSNSADVTARNLLYIKNDNAAAVGAIPLTIANDAVISSKWVVAMKLASITIYVGTDETEPEGALTGVKGDLCFNSTDGSISYCDANGTNWTKLT